MVERRDLLTGMLAVGAALPLAKFAGVGTAKAAAPMQGPSRPTVYRFELGSFEVTTILDGAIQLDGPHPIFGQDQDAETVAAYARDNNLPSDRMAISFTPLLVNTGSELILFDTGNGAARRPNAGNLVAMLGAAGYSADQVDTVVITHMHPDHIGGLMEDGVPVFANAGYVTGETEYDFWSSEDRLSGPTEGVGKLVQSNVVPLAEKIGFVKDGSDVVAGVTAVAAHGHTPGHMAYHLESDGQRLLIWADAANHYVMSVQRPDWHVRFDMDKDAAAATRKRLFDMAAADGIPVTGYHMPFPAVGYIEKSDQDYRWVQASYQLDL